MNKNDSLLRKNCTLLSCCAVLSVLIVGIFILYRPNTQSSSSMHAPHVVKKSKAEKTITDNITIKPNYIGKNLVKGD